ncbi:alpha/beta fold hydrolase [Prochlorothrix hollandica]|uniref:alpha/beta fold hydrolase n=1 Tax=Prochlorothrix hollandica TaxID=1223 RepID=UPI003342DB98
MSASSTSTVLWICTSPSLKRFNQPLLAQLAPHATVLEWEYCQDPDRGCSLDQTVDLLHNFIRRFLQTQTQPRHLHLAGHSISGVVALLYARRHPQWVRSLSLVGVGAQPGVTWHSYYYLRRQLTRWSRPVLMSQMVVSLFGEQSRSNHLCLRRRLEQDLDHALSPHSLLRPGVIAQGSPNAPLLLAGAADDTIIDPVSVQGWQEFLKPCDRLWIAPQGRHFFHNTYPAPVAEQLLRFWDSLPEVSPTSQTPTASPRSQTSTG